VDALKLHKIALKIGHKISWAHYIGSSAPTCLFRFDARNKGENVSRGVVAVSEAGDTQRSDTFTVPKPSHLASHAAAPAGVC